MVTGRHFYHLLTVTGRLQGRARPSAIHTLHCLSRRGTFSSLTLKKPLLDSAPVLHIKTEPANQQVTDVLIIPPQAELLHTPVPLQLNEIICGGHTTHTHTHRFDRNTEAFRFRYITGGKVHPFGLDYLKRSKGTSIFECICQIHC